MCVIVIGFLECLCWSTRWNGKRRIIQNVKFILFSSIKTNFVRTSYYYWRFAYSTLPTWGSSISYLAIFMKGYKPWNGDLIDQIWFDQSMNIGHVLIENAIGTLKNRWRIFKKINVHINWAPMIILVVPCIIFVNCKVFLNWWFTMFKHEEILLWVLLVCIY